MIVMDRAKRIRALKKTLQDYMEMGMSQELISALEQEIIFLKSCRSSLQLNIPIKENE